MITEFKIFEKYNNNKLNELVIKYFNDESDAIIEIIDSYESISDVKNILEKISFLIESLGDVEEIPGKMIYIDTKDKNEQTFFYDIRNKKFRITTYNNFMTVSESLLKTINFKDLEVKNKWCNDVSEIFDELYCSECYGDNNIWGFSMDETIGDRYIIQINRMQGYVEFIKNPEIFQYHREKSKEEILLKTSWEDDNIEEFNTFVNTYLDLDKFNI